MEGKTFLREFNLSIRGCGMRVRFGRLGFLLPKSETSDHWRVVHQHIDSYVDKTLKGIDSKSYGAKQLSLLESLAQQTSDRLEMRNQVIQGMMAASENVPILLSNTIFLLSRHPAVWKQLRDAVLNVGPQVLDLDTARRIKPIQNILNECEFLNTWKMTLLRLASISSSTIPSLRSISPRCPSRHSTSKRRRATGWPAGLCACWHGSSLRLLCSASSRGNFWWRCRRV